jgi:tetratricopeptide (TPR) repeat protein
VTFEAAEVNFWSGNYKVARELYISSSASAKLAAKSLYQAGYMSLILKDFGVATEYFKKSLEHDDKNLETRIRLAEVLSYDKRFTESIDQYNLVLAIEPENLDALTGKADVLSWQNNFAKSVAVYDERLGISFDPKIARQKARVLGWWKKYDKSLDAYHDAWKKSGDDNIKLEMDAKRAWWNKWVLTSLSKYGKQVELEPDNLETRFDLAQAQAYQRIWKIAESNFRDTLNRYEGHFRASDSLKKIEVQRRPWVRPEVSFFRAKSGEFITHVNHLAAGLSFGDSVNEYFDFFAGYMFDLFHFRDFRAVERNRGRVGIGAYWPANLSFNASYVPIEYQDSGRFSHNFDFNLSGRPFDPILATVFAKRDDLASNHTVFEKRLRATDFGGRIKADLNRRWTTFADGSYSWLNDGNRRYGVGLENLFFINYEPKRLSVDIRFDMYGYDRINSDYWSPNNFWSTSAVLHWRHYLNKHDLYYGALDTYYGFKYRFNIDKEGNIFNGGAAEFYHDFNHKTSIGLEVSGIYSGVYDDFGAFLNFMRRF